jgi:hypothetical protein
MDFKQQSKYPEIDSDAKTGIMSRNIRECVPTQLNIIKDCEAGFQHCDIESGF